MEGMLSLKSTSPSCSSRDPSLPSVPDGQEALYVQPSPVANGTEAPPPPPPPPPLPPAPPPPAFFGSCDIQRRSMKKLNWDTLPNHHVLGKLNVWTSKRTQRDLVLDIQTMEELFSHDDKSASLRASKVFSSSKSDGMNLCGQESQVTNRYVQIRNRLSMQALLSFSFFMSLQII